MTKQDSDEIKRLTQITERLYTCVVGIENTDDNGMAGDVTDILDHLKELNGQVNRNTTFRKIGTWLSGAMVMALLSLLVKLFGS